MFRKMRTEVDKILEAVASLDCTLGTDSTRRERSAVRSKQRKLLLKIRSIDELFFERIAADV